MALNNLSQNGNAGMGMTGGYNQPMNNGMPMNQGYAPAGAYGQPNPYTQQNQYNQPMNNGYNQPMNQGYNQQPAYSQQPVSQSWVCPSCQANNDGGRFCAFCGTPKQ